MDRDSSENDDFSPTCRNNRQHDKDFDPNDYYNEQDSEDTENENNNEAEEEKNTDYEDGCGGNIFPGGHRFNEKFVCIRYPGNVINANKAIDSLGGIEQISTAITTSNRRLELRFRPTDGYCKPACGDRHTVSGFILRVRTKKSRGQSVTIENKQKLFQTFRNHESAMPINPSKVDIEENIRDVTKNLENYSIDQKKNVEKKITTNSDKIEVESLMNPSPFGKLDKENTTPTFDHNKYENLSENENYELPKLKVLGRIETEFRFTNLCDFQYLPVTRNFKDAQRNECLYESLYPTGIPPYRWLETKVPYFFPPAIFSRMDSVQQFSLKTESKDTGTETVIGKTRKRRAGFSNFINFNSETLPTEPPKGIETAMRVKFLSQHHLQMIRGLFEERPIWSKNALMYKTNFTNDQLKILLPSCAYYFMTGPWRIMWVRLGYDPRVDPTARKYQTLDYRLKSMHGLEQNVKGKRTYSHYILPYKSAPNAKPKTAVLRTMAVEEEVRIGKSLSEDVYIYREGVIPPSRQMFYQYCDVLADDIQEMLRKLPDPLPGVKCHEKRGWLPNGFSDQCREIINRQVRALLRKQMNIPEDHPTSLPRKRRRSKGLKVPHGRHEKRRKLMEKKNTKQKREVGSSDNESDPDWEDI